MFGQGRFLGEVAGGLSISVGQASVLDGGRWIGVAVGG